MFESNFSSFSNNDLLLFILLCEPFKNAFSVGKKRISFEMIELRIYLECR